MKETTRDKRNLKRVIYRLKLALKNLEIVDIVAGHVSHLLDEDIQDRIKDSRLNTVAALLGIKKLVK